MIFPLPRMELHGKNQHQLCPGTPGLPAFRPRQADEPIAAPRTKLRYGYIVTLPFGVTLPFSAQYSGNFQIEQNKAPHGPLTLLRNYELIAIIFTDGPIHDFEANFIFKQSLKDIISS